MQVLMWILRIYSWIIIVWALSSWVQQTPQVIRDLLWYAAWPVYKSFGWARIGNLNLAPIIALVLLMWADSYLRNRSGQGMPEVIEPGSDKEQSAGAG